MKELRKKIRAAFVFLLLELILAGVILIVAAIVEIPEGIHIDRAAFFLGIEMFCHALLGFSEIKRMKQPPVAEGEL